jgi:hypothetical protein
VAEGTPNRVRATAGAERSRALRASRSVHESREWARGVRDRGAGANVELAERRKLHSHFHMLVPKQLHAHPSMVPTAPIMRSRTGAEPITNGCSRTLTRAPASRLRYPAIDTVRAVGRDDNCGYWLHTRHASCHRLRAVAPGRAVPGWLDSEGCRLVGV